MVGARMIPHCWILQNFADRLVFIWVPHEALQLLDPHLIPADEKTTTTMGNLSSLF